MSEETGKGIDVEGHLDMLTRKAALCDRMAQAGEGLSLTLARYHDRNENHYIGHDDKEQRCEGCGAIEEWEKAKAEFDREAKK